MKELPLSLTINGVTYYSQHHLATAQTTWFEMGKEAGMVMGASSGVNEIKLDIEWNEGYEIGKYEGYKEGYTTGFDNGLDSATIANTTAVKPSPCNHGECIASNEEAFSKGYKTAYAEYEKKKHETWKVK
jgi:hypothetical protein